MVTVTRTSQNIEIFRKLLNSVANKYDCGVRFDLDGVRLSFRGDRAAAHEILRETLAMVGAS